MRVNKEFGVLVQLIIQSIKDLYNFIIFFFSWILLTACVKMIFGTKVSHEDYKDLNGYMALVMDTFRNSVGDIHPPEITLMKTIEDDVGPFCFNFVVTSIWLVWSLNIVFLLIVLLNFLIAVISQSY